jgi:phage-related protein (TIGR01555 family)
MPVKTSARKAVAKKQSRPSVDSPKKKVVVDAMKVFSTEDKKARAALTADGFDNFISRIGLNNDNALSAGTYEFNLVTRNRIKLEAAYRGSWVVGAVIDSIAEDMTRAGIDITTNEGEEDLKDLQNAISRLQVWQSFSSLIKWGRLYGGAIGIIQIKGQKLDTPLDLDTVAKDQFQGLVVYDRWQLNPVLNEVIDSGPEMGLPSFYQIVNNLTSLQPDAPTATGQITVHHSRVIRYTGIDLPYFQAITEMMWGESVLERLWDRLISFDNATMSSASLIDRANLRTVGIEGLREIIAAGGQAQAGLESMFEMMRLMQVNEGLTLIDKNDTFESTAYSFAGLSDMMLQFGQQLSGASGIPLVRLFGQSPAGLSATGEADMRLYYDQINQQQESRCRNGWEILLKVLWRSTFGKPAPKDLEFGFTPLWQMSATDKAMNAKTNTETITGAYEAGLTDRATSLKELRQTSGDTGIFSNISDEDIKEAEDEEPPMPEEDPAEQDAPADLPEPGKEKEPVKNFDSVIGKMKKWLSK